MIRKFRETDTDLILDIWLAASVKAHDFVEASFWEAQTQKIRDVYIPASETYVFEQYSEPAGFYSLYNNTLGALFVHPAFQGMGIGKQLLAHAKAQRSPLTLAVYKENEISVQFYLSQGFTIVSEQTEEATGHQEYTMIVNMASVR